MLRQLMMLACAGVLMTGCTSGLHVHVSPAGDDAAAGTKGAPLATLAAARDRVREIQKTAEKPEPIAVVLHDGVYRQTEPLKFEAADSGSAEAPITYRAARGQTPRIIGGTIVSGFVPLGDDPAGKRLSEAAKQAVRVVDLKAAGITDYGKLIPFGFSRGGQAQMELFFNDEPMRLAQYPNAGWLTIDKPVKDHTDEAFTYQGDRAARWADEADPWLYGYWFHGWADQFLPIKTIEPDKKTITVAAKHGYGFRAGARYFALNLLCELDSPGEYYIDRAAGKLYFWPPSPIESGRAIVSQVMGNLIDMNNVSHVRLQGLTIEAARGSGVRLTDCDHVEIAGCTIRNLGDSGVNVSSGHDNRVVGCEVTQTAGNGISMHAGDRKTLTPANHEAVNNDIHHVGRLRRTYTPGISIGGVGQRIAHNSIHNMPHAGILYGGNDHIIEYNDIHHVLLETDDSGAIYIGRNWTTRGHIVRYNYIHHSGPAWAPPVPEAMRTEPHVVYEPMHRHGANIVYHDDASSGITVVGNILHGGDRGMLLGGGRDNITVNNIFIGCKMGVWIDARGLGWAKKHAEKGGGWQMYKKLEQVNYDQPPYSTRYPALAKILEGNPPAPEGNVVERNVFIDCKEWLALHGPKESDIQLADNLHALEIEYDPADPLAAVKALDPAALKKIGFEAIPIDQIGPQK
ncbi:right-handed parallel beta-helix repeat-containing protein [Planctomycetales bacterium ZRK34]|nr:right-handed parallel beta-helix repeat-containing protein [Planctomycetales bacterium ZRK34]